MPVEILCGTVEELSEISLTALMCKQGYAPFDKAFKEWLNDEAGSAGLQ